MVDYIGQQLGNYRLLRLLGTGSFAAVYLGEHLFLERLAAIKVLQMQMDPQAFAAFQREARTIAHLDHPHIVRVLDYGIEDQVPYLVMDYTPNGTLRTRHPRGTRLSFEQIVAYVKQIASALDYAHEQHVIHRDVKPENVLLNSKGELVLSDFGIAVVQRTLNTLSTQNMAGTPLYMAPEQILQHPCPASDQYALAVMVYEWLCGKPPFPGPGTAVFGQHLYQEPPGLCSRIPGLPQAVEDTVLGALAREPARRFASVQDFAIALEEACFATQPLVASAALENSPSELDASTLPWPATARPAGPAAAPHTTQLQAFSAPAASASYQSQPSEQQTQRAPVLTSVALRNRLALLRKVRSIWVSGVLAHSLHGAALIEPGLQEQPSAVADPWQLVLHHLEKAPYSLPTGTHISKIYDEACGELLILGAPGAGKTTLLLELARVLLERAEVDESQAVPVVFPLSSWADKQLPLQDWLVQELRFKYQVPAQLAQALVSTDQILPLLDGLDEVAATARVACVEAINAFRQEHGLLPLVVCSRSTDYLAQATRIRLHTAVTIQPLSAQQVDAYLASSKDALLALRVAWHQDATLRELISTPLMLSLAVLAYRYVSPAELTRQRSLAACQHQILEHYVARMLQRSGSRHYRYTVEQTMHRLSWLACQLSQHNQTVFYIEQLQPDWLPNRFLRWLYAALAVRSIEAFIGLWVGILSSFLFTGYVYGIGIQVYAPIGLIIGLFTRRGSRLRALQCSPGRQRLSSIRPGPILAGLLMTPLAVLLTDTYANATVFKLSTCLGGLIGLTIGVLLSWRTVAIQPVEVITWSWKNCIRVRHLYIGLMLGLGVGALDWQIFSHKNYVLLYALFTFLSSWFVSALLSGLSAERLDDHHRIVPNQGMQHSARNGRRLGCLVGLISGVILALSIKLFYSIIFTSMFYPNIYATSYGICSALGIGLLGWLFSGGDAAIKHRVLRCLLWCAGVIPWKFPDFLDYAAEATLLCKVGGGYIFAHRLLLEYFASLSHKSIASTDKFSVVKQREKE
jgi:serine/threonine protein kinase/predicted ATPase/tetrahydromethanopterin S-methyltransferase subunit G